MWDDGTSGEGVVAKGIDRIHVSLLNLKNISEVTMMLSFGKTRRCVVYTISALEMFYESKTRKSKMLVEIP